MPTRFKTSARTNYGIAPLPMGYPTDGATSQFVIPSVGIEDVDTALFTLFDSEIPFAVGGIDGTSLMKVPILFAGGEKWALLKRDKPLRDKNGVLILPLITIGRPGIAQVIPDDQAGRGINQHTGEIIIRRRLDESDRDYQNLINRIFLQHQKVTAVAPTVADSGQLSTLRTTGELSSVGGPLDDALFTMNRMNNVYETLVVPSPQFFTVNYDVTIWTQYTHHMNQVLETMMSSFLPQVRGWRIDTPKGYWFVATLSGDAWDAETNFDDMSKGERIIKYKFAINVPAYMLASSAPGVPITVKRYVSCPSVSFSTTADLNEDTDVATIADPMLGADDPTLPLASQKTRNMGQRRTGCDRLYVQGEQIDPNDPALLGLPRGRAPGRFKRVTVLNDVGKKVTRLVRVASINTMTGETSFAPGTDLSGLSIIVED